MKLHWEVLPSEALETPTGQVIIQGHVDFSFQNFAKLYHVGIRSYYQWYIGEAAMMSSTRDTLKSNPKKKFRAVIKLLQSYCSLSQKSCKKNKWKLTLCCQVENQG